MTSRDANQGQSAAALGRAIASGAKDPRDLLEEMLGVAEARPDIYVRVTVDRARRAAGAAAERAKRGMTRGPLDGVPISWKDLFDMTGEKTQAGTRMLAEDPPAQTDAVVVARADSAGLVPVGKTHLSELAFSGLGVNPMTATPPNSADSTRAPGGSSSGAAISVTAGSAAAGIGSDTGGSVRIPAAWNGLVGLKTTSGLVPLDGVAPLSPTLDTVGPLTRTVEDAALLHGVLAGCAAPDLAGADLAGRVFLVDDGIMLEGMPDDRRATFEAAVDAIAGAGARIKRIRTTEFSEALETAARDGALVNTEGYGVWRDRLEAAPELVWDRILERFRSGARFTADQGERARLAFTRLGGSIVARMSGADALLAPTSPIAPPVIDRVMADEAYYVEQNLMALRNTRAGNLLRLSALTLPAGRDANGLHCGLMLYAPPFAEARLLRLGAALEHPLASL